jgi:hypothetical protein
LNFNFPAVLLNNLVGDEKAKACTFVFLCRPLNGKGKRLLFSLRTLRLERQALQQIMRRYGIKADPLR